MRVSPVVLLLFLATVVHADSPRSDFSRGEKMLDAYFRRRVQQISDRCLTDIGSKDDWERQRPELRRQFLDMLGLWPLPQRTELKPEVTGKLDAGRYVVEKLSFQSMPGLYVTGNLYVPKNAKALPAVLYVCGHGNVVKDGVSYGSKVSYQHHPAWFAQNGYVCLILDTLELGEIPGDHHGTSRRGQWWWQAIGYTPASVECWNGMRALDYLQTRPEVDPERIGVTGRSGGGATSWWVAAADDRVKCVVPVAGIADLHAHLVDGENDRFKSGGVIGGHCDCMYMVNTFQWDFPLVAALCAPRPLLLGNSDADLIFPVGGYRRLADKVRRVYDLYGASEKFALLETKGPHKDTPELRTGAFRWLNRWLKNDLGPVVDNSQGAFAAKDLKVLHAVPTKAVNPVIHEHFVRVQQVALPNSPQFTKDWWSKTAKGWRTTLQVSVFSGWPRQAPPLNVRLAADISRDGLRLRAYDFFSEDEIELRLWIATAAQVEKPAAVVLTAVDEQGWHDWLSALGEDFTAAFPNVKMPRRDDARFHQTVKTLGFYRWAHATLAPRGIGPTRWAETNSPGDVLARRRFALIGQTLDGQRVWDVRRGISALQIGNDNHTTPVWLQGSGEMAAIVLHAAIFEPDVKRLDLWQPPSSYRQGPTFLNVLRHFDLPQSLILADTQEIRLHVKDTTERRAWDWPDLVLRQLGSDRLKIRIVGD